MEGGHWNTLGVALYRAGDLKGTVHALMKSMSLTGDNAQDDFFLAMARWRLGDKIAAQDLYGQAVTWMEKNAPHDQELVRFRAEAEGLLGLDVKASKNGEGERDA